MEAAQRSDRCTEHDFRRGLRDLGLEVSDERFDVLLKVLEKVAMGHAAWSAEFFFVAGCWFYLHVLDFDVGYLANEWLVTVVDEQSCKSCLES